MLILFNNWNLNHEVSQPSLGNAMSEEYSGIIVVPTEMGHRTQSVEVLWRPGAPPLPVPCEGASPSPPGECTHPRAARTLGRSPARSLRIFRWALPALQPWQLLSSEPEAPLWSGDDDCSLTPPECVREQARERWEVTSAYKLLVSLRCKDFLHFHNPACISGTFFIR